MVCTYNLNDVHRLCTAQESLNIHPLSLRVCLSDNYKVVVERRVSGAFVRRR